MPPAATRTTWPASSRSTSRTNSRALMAETLAHPAHRRGADPGDRPERQVHAVDAVHQARRQAGAGLAPGRGLHPDPRPLARRRVDRARRRHVDNGCLWVIPGSHRPGILWPLRQHANPEYDFAPESYRLPLSRRGRDSGRGGAGSIVFFHGYLLHKSLKNRRTAGFRRALVNHYMSAESLLPWWQPGGPAPADPRQSRHRPGRGLRSLCLEGHRGTEQALCPCGDRVIETIRVDAGFAGSHGR